MAGLALQPNDDVKGRVSWSVVPPAEALAAEAREGHSLSAISDSGSNSGDGEGLRVKRPVKRAKAVTTSDILSDPRFVAHTGTLAHWLHAVAASNGSQPRLNISVLPQQQTTTPPYPCKNRFQEAELAVTGKAFDILVASGEIEVLATRIRIFARMTPVIDCSRSSAASLDAAFARGSCPNFSF